MMTRSSDPPKTREQWKLSLEDLPTVSSPPGKIPAFYFGHGQPMLIWPSSLPAPNDEIFAYAGSAGPLANFLKDFGPVLLKKYSPKAIVVFSAHWESRECLVTDYEDENPLLMDYYGFNSELYKVQFRSCGDTTLSQRIVSLLEEHGIPARTSTRLESRGKDGRGFDGPGLDHGVFIPFKLMFGDSLDIPVVQVSIDQSLEAEKNWNLGHALEKLRSEGILILAGGLTIHTFHDFSAFSENTAKPIFRDFDKAVIDAVRAPTPETRRKALMNLILHPVFRKAHPREEHFIPLYIAAGAGESGQAEVISGIYGAPTFAFGL